MPPRRSHKKSRAGCHKCKARKIKVMQIRPPVPSPSVSTLLTPLQCDEVHPRCGNCVKHGVVCDFESRPSPNELVLARTPVATPSATPSAPRPPSSLSQPSPEPDLVPPRTCRLPRQPDRFLELRLLHYFTTSTAYTLFTCSPSAEDIWQRAVPQMAFQDRSYLMDAILSVAALHLRSQKPDDEALARASHAYAASALAEYCAYLERGITADNAEALFLTASLIAFQSTASRIFLKEDSDSNAATAEVANRYTLPLPWFHAFQGVKSVVATSWQWIQTSDVVKAVIDSQPSFQLDLNPLAPGSFFGHLLEGVDEELADELPQHVSATGSGYSHAVSVLNWAHKNAYAPAALAFPASVSRRFIDLVAEKRPRALAILACFFALLKRMDDVWWLADVARREVTGLVAMFEPGSPWWRHLEWPVRISVWDGTTMPPDVWGVECERQPRGDKGLAETMMSHIELLTKLSSQAPKSPLIAGAGGGELGLTAAPLD